MSNVKHAIKRTLTFLLAFAMVVTSLYVVPAKEVQAAVGAPSISKNTLTYAEYLALNTPATIGELGLRVEGADFTVRDISEATAAEDRKCAVVSLTEDRSGVDGESGGTYKVTVSGNIYAAEEDSGNNGSFIWAENATISSTELEITVSPAITMKVTTSDLTLEGSGAQLTADYTAESEETKTITLTVTDAEDNAITDLDTADITVTKSGASVASGVEVVNTDNTKGEYKVSFTAAGATSDKQEGAVTITLKKDGYVTTTIVVSVVVEAASSSGSGGTDIDTYTVEIDETNTSSVVEKIADKGFADSVKVVVKKNYENVASAKVLVVNADEITKENNEVVGEGVEGVYAYTLKSKKDDEDATLEDSEFNDEVETKVTKLEYYTVAAGAKWSELNSAKTLTTNGDAAVSQVVVPEDGYLKLSADDIVMAEYEAFGDKLESAVSFKAFDKAAFKTAWDAYKAYDPAQGGTAPKAPNATDETYYVASSNVNVITKKYDGEGETIPATAQYYVEATDDGNNNEVINTVEVKEYNVKIKAYEIIQPDANAAAGAKATIAKTTTANLTKKGAKVSVKEAFNVKTIKNQINVLDESTFGAMISKLGVAINAYNGVKDDNYYSKTNTEVTSTTALTEGEGYWIEYTVKENGTDVVVGQGETLDSKKFDVAKTYVVNVKVKGLKNKVACGAYPAAGTDVAVTVQKNGALDDFTVAPFSIPTKAKKLMDAELEANLYDKLKVYKTGSTTAQTYYTSEEWAEMYTEYGTNNQKPQGAPENAVGTSEETAGDYYVVTLPNSISYSNAGATAKTQNTLADVKVEHYVIKEKVVTKENDSVTKDVKFYVTPANGTIVDLKYDLEKGADDKYHIGLPYTSGAAMLKQLQEELKNATRLTAWENGWAYDVNDDGSDNTEAPHYRDNFVQTAPAEFTDDWTVKYLWAIDTIDDISDNPDEEGDELATKLESALDASYTVVAKVTPYVGKPDPEDEEKFVKDERASQTVNVVVKIELKNKVTVTMPDKAYTIQKGSSVSSAPEFVIANYPGAWVNADTGAVIDLVNDPIYSDVGIVKPVATTTGTKGDDGLTYYLATIPNAIYNGAVQKPAIVVYTDAGVVPSKSYTVKYFLDSKAKNPKDATTYQVEVTLKDKSKSKITGTYTIEKFDITCVELGIDQAVTLNSKNEGSVKVIQSIKVGKMKLAIGKDYYYEINGVAGYKAEDKKAAKAPLKAAGEYTIKVTTKSDSTNFKGTNDECVVGAAGKNALIKNAKVTIAKSKTLEKCDVDLGANVIAATVTMKDGKGVFKTADGVGYEVWDNVGNFICYRYEIPSAVMSTDEDRPYYVYVDYYNINKIGKASVVVSAEPKTGYYGTKTAKYSIKANNAQKLTKSKAGAFIKTLNKQSVPFNNSAWTLESVWKELHPDDPTSAAIENDDKAMVKALNEAMAPAVYGSDFTVTYKKNISAGKATITFKGVEDKGWSGSFTQTFKISKPDLATAFKAYDGTGETVQYEVSGISKSPKAELEASSVEELQTKATASGLKLATNDAGKLLLSDEKAILEYTYAGLDTEAATDNLPYNLVLGKDYTVSYKNNKAAAGKDITITIKGKGSFQGKIVIKIPAKKQDTSGTNQS